VDQTPTAFREAADRENQHRRLRRRYSLTLRQQAVAYWHQHRSEDGVRTIAASLGVSVTTLQRWTRAASGRPRFRPIAVRSPTAASENASVVIHITADGPRVVGLTVETAARLLTLLR
jgi:transposase-like protein